MILIRQGGGEKNKEGKKWKREEKKELMKRGRIVKE